MDGRGGGAAQGVGDAVRSRHWGGDCDGGADGAARAFHGDRRREALHGAPVVREAAAGHAAVDKRKRNATSRAVERATKHQCKKDERQTAALLATARNWSAHMFDSKRADSVTCKAALVEHRFIR